MKGMSCSWREGSSVDIDLNKGDVMGATETQSITKTKMNRITLLSKGDLRRSFESLMHQPRVLERMLP